MKIEYDNEIDAVYIRLQEKYVDRYSLSDIFNISTENLILERTMMKKEA